MSQFKDIMKNGWHPEKSGTGIRGSVSGLMGRNKDNKDDSSLNHVHVARPLTDLKDPASFAPPPRRTGSGLAPPPSPVSTKRKVVAAPSKYADPRAGPVELPPRNTGSGVESGEASPTRDAADRRSPPSYDEATSGAAVSKAPPRSLPPRLPPRGAAGGGEKSGHLNEGAVSRLGAAGVSVPALGIGRGGAAHSTSPSPPPASSRASPSAEAGAASGSGAGKWGAQVNQLQGRFAKMATPSAASSAQEQQPSQGTSWAQKQAAFKTASAFQKDPSSVSFSDAKAAASTANNFRQRHGEQVAAGAKAANKFSQNCGIADKLGAYAGSQSTQPTQNKSEPPPLPGPSQPYTGATNDAAQAAVSGLAGKKKPPPPPPKKKPGLAAAAAAPDPASAAQGDMPPPIPMSTRPQF